MCPVPGILALFIIDILSHFPFLLKIPVIIFALLFFYIMYQPAFDEREWQQYDSTTKCVSRVAPV